MEQPNDKEKSSKKKVRSRRGKKKKSKTSSNEENPIPKELERVLKPNADPKEQIEANTNEPIQLQGVSDSEKDSGGSVLVEKLNEPLDAALQAYESRITALTELPKKLQEYPNPREEKINLSVHQQLIRDTQTLLEGPPPTYKRGPASAKPTLETIIEATPSVEKGSEAVSLPPVDDIPIVDTLENNDELTSLFTPVDQGDEIPEFEEALANEMWTAVQRKVNEQDDSPKSPPFSIVDFTSRRATDEDNLSLFEELQTAESARSKHTLKTMPSYLGESERHYQTIQVPSLRKNLLENTNTSNLHSIMSTLVT